MFSYFYEHDVSTHLDEWLNILVYLGEETPSSDEIWDLVKGAKNAPHIGNIEQSIVLSNIARVTEERYKISLEFSVNAYDTHLFIGSDYNNSINSLNDYLELIQEKEKAA